MLNPFIIAGLILSGVGLLQEISEVDNPKPKIGAAGKPGEPGKAGKPGAPGVAGKPGEPGKPGEQGKASDG